jgi:phage tail protein X
MAGVGEGIAQELEVALWKGNKQSGAANLNKFDGIIKIADDATLAETVTFAAGDTVSSIVAKIYAAIPTKAFSKGEVVLYMGADNYRKYIQELIANGNLVITNTVNDVAMPESVLIPGTNVRVIYVPGLDGTNRYFASYKDNFVYGVDMTGDEEKYDLWYSQDNREHRLAVEFVAGVQIAFPDMVVTAKQA